MLLQYRVKNYASFKDEACLSMIANSSKDNAINIVKEGKNNVLKCASIYGANASGKTNLLKSFTSSIRFIRESFLLSPNSKLTYFEPFALDYTNPCEFEYIFIYNNIKYVYGFSVTIDKVIEEYLYAYYSSKATEIFNRTDTNNYKFIYDDEKELRNYERLTLDNKLFLSVLGNSKYEKTKDPFEWFNQCIDTFIGGIESAVNGFSFTCYDNDKDGSLKKFTLALLNAADILIEDYSFESKEVVFDPIFIAQNSPLKVPNSKQVKINMKHLVKDDDGNKEFYLDFFKSESAGTKILFMLAPILKNAFETGKTLYIDEFENGLHPYLLESIIKMFNNPNYNTGNAQLIINTHSTYLLSLDLFRRDQIWFVEKDSNTGQSSLYSLDDFSVRKEENIQKGYLNGRYGAVPFFEFGDDAFWKEKN